MIKTLLRKIGKWIDLVAYPYNSELKSIFYLCLLDKKINKVECFYLNWVGYLLSNNSNYYWIFWELLNPLSSLYKYKIYYSNPWKEEINYVDYFE